MSAFVLFMPAELAEQIGIFYYRTTYKGLWWLLLVLSGALWIGAVIQFFINKIIGRWLEKCRTKKSLDLRLRSLSQDELMWIKLCLLRNTQTLSAVQVNRSAQSLVSKGILIEGTGSILDLPFHFPDYVWRYLLKHKNDFLTPNEIGNKTFLRELAQYEASLHRLY